MSWLLTVRLRLWLLGVLVTAGSALIFLQETAAANATPTNAAELGNELCGGATVTLAAPISDPSARVTMGATCVATLDLNGQAVTVGDVVIGNGGTLTIEDRSGSPATLTATSPVAGGAPGIRTTGATLIVRSGAVIATGRTGGAGIGGGQNENGGTVNITGGTVTATGVTGGAGIGGGQFGNGGTVTISSGVVEATGAGGSAGIGGGQNGNGGTVNITGGTVTATGVSGGAGIGGGQDGAGGTVVISSGTVTATAGIVGAAPIGPGTGGAAGTVTIPLSATDSTVGLVRSISFPAPPAPPVPSLRVVCGAEGVSVGATVVCKVSGGDAGIEILWRAAYNPVIAEAGVTLDASGSGEFSFVVPAAALGEELTVELVEWLAPVSLGVAGGPVPGSVPAGDGPVPVWPILLAALSGVGLLRRGMRAQV